MRFNPAFGTSLFPYYSLLSNYQDTSTLINCLLNSNTPTLIPVYAGPDRDLVVLSHMTATRFDLAAQVSKSVTEPSTQDKVDVTYFTERQVRFLRHVQLASLILSVAGDSSPQLYKLLPENHVPILRYRHTMTLIPMKQHPPQRHQSSKHILLAEYLPATFLHLVSALFAVEIAKHRKRLIMVRCQMRKRHYECLLEGMNEYVISSAGYGRCTKQMPLRAEGLYKQIGRPRSWVCVREIKGAILLNECHEGVRHGFNSHIVDTVASPKLEGRLMLLYQANWEDLSRGKALTLMEYRRSFILGLNLDQCGLY